MEIKPAKIIQTVRTFYFVSYYKFGEVRCRDLRPAMYDYVTYTGYTVNIIIIIIIIVRKTL